MPADGATPNYALVLPEVGASADSWGTKTNANWTSVDADMHAISAAQGNYLLLTGGTLSGGIVVGGIGINYSTYSGHWFAFGWDGSFATVSVDNGLYTAELASTAWVNGNFKNIGAYTPNQNVDYGASPVFGNYNTAAASDGRYLFKTGDTCSGSLTVNGNLNTGGTITSGSGLYAGGSGVVYNTYGGNAFAFTWDGYTIHSVVNGGDQGPLIRTTSAPFGIFQLYVDSSHSLILDVLTSGYFYVATTAGSDRRLKDNARPASVDALAIVNRVGVHDVDLRSPGDADAAPEHWQCSLMADEVGEHIPNAWIHGQEGRYDGLRDLPLICTLWRAVQQLSTRVAELEARA